MGNVSLTCASATPAPFWDLLIAHSDGTPDRALFSNASLASMVYEPAWSPDGKTLVIPVSQPTPDALSGLLGVDVASGKQHAGILSGRPGLFRSEMAAGWQQPGVDHR